MSIFTEEHRRIVNDSMPALTDRPGGINLLALLDAQFDALDAATLANNVPSADGISGKRIARATFDPSANTAQRTVGAHGLGVTLPDNAIVVRSWYEVVTTFTSPTTDAASIALGFPTDGSAAGIKAATTIANVANAWDAGNVEGIQVGTAATFHTKLTAARELTATVAIEDLTAGKLTVFAEYVIGN